MTRCRQLTFALMVFGLSLAWRSDRLSAESFPPRRHNRALPEARYSRQPSFHAVRQTVEPPPEAEPAPKAPPAEPEPVPEAPPAGAEPAPEAPPAEPEPAREGPPAKVKPFHSPDFESRIINPPVYSNFSNVVTYEPPPPCDDRWECGWNVNYVPNMLGDFFGAGTDLLTVRGDELLNALPADVLDPLALGTGAETDFLLISPGHSVLGRQKAAENNSPLPRNRVFLNYSYLANTSLQDGGVGVHRVTPGLERTFVDDRFSWELRVPMGVTFDSDSILTGGASRDQAEFGNVHFGLKSLLVSRSDWVLSAGLGATFPTADDLSFSNANGRELIRVENGAVHLLPYLAGAWSDGGWFVQSFFQLDYDLSRNSVLIDDGTGLMKAGEFRDSDFLYWDIGAGYWLFKDRGGLVTGIAPTMELHYNTALNTTKGVQSASGFQFGGNRSQVEVVNLVLGATFQLSDGNSLALGYATPVGGGDDEQFDSELRILLNWYFGGK